MRAAIALCRSTLPLGVRPFSVTAFQLAGAPSNATQRQRETLQRVEEQAKNDDIKAQLALGRFYAEGSHTLQQDAALAAHWFAKVAEGGDVRGLIELGSLYSNPRLSIVDVHKAEKYFIEAKAKGSTAAANHLARLYISPGPLHDPNKGLKLLQEAVEKGDATATHFLSQLYRTGEVASIPVDAAKAQELLVKAAEAGSAAAQITLSRQLLYGLEGVEKNLEKAKELIDAAVKRDLRASVIFANAFRDDPTRKDEITTYLRRATADGVPGAYATLAEHYYIIKDWANASRIYNKISTQYIAQGQQGQQAGNEAAAARRRRMTSVAQFRLGKMYVTGWEGQQADLHQARVWFQRAANNGSTVANFELGKIFVTEGDDSQAMDAFARAGELPIAAAQLGLLLLKKNTEQDSRTAELHLVAAAGKGSLLAARTLTAVYSRGAPGIPADLVKAEKYRLLSVRNPRTEEAKEQ